MSLLPTVEAQNFLGRPPDGNPRLVRYVFNLVDLRRRLTRDVVALLRRRLGRTMMGIVNYDDSFGDAVAHQQLVIDRAPMSKATSDVRGLAAAIRELLPPIRNPKRDDNSCERSSNREPAGFSIGAKLLYLLFARSGSSCRPSSSSRRSIFRRRQLLAFFALSCSSSSIASRPAWLR